MNPWLTISLSDYEGHMSLPLVAQAQALAGVFGEMLAQYRPGSAALLGCSGGNGLDRADPSVTPRVVVLDINPRYVETAAARFGGRFEKLEPIVRDIAGMEAAPFAPVDLAFAGLLLEYLPLLPALRFLRSSLLPGGMLGCVLQEESHSIERVSPSPYAKNLSVLAPIMRLLDPSGVVRDAEGCGLEALSSRAIGMPNGKVLVFQTYRAA